MYIQHYSAMNVQELSNKYTTKCTTGASLQSKLNA